MMSMFSLSLSLSLLSPRVPLHTRVWESVLSLLSVSGGPNPTLFKAVTWALYYLVETNGNVVHQDTCMSTCTCMNVYYM